MKKIFGIFILAAALISAVSCDNITNQQEGPTIVFNEGAVGLIDQEFGMYYGDKRNNEIAVYNVVLSDAVCFRDGYGVPYLDSEGDMLVLEFNAELPEEGAPVALPTGVYTIGADEPGTKFINLENSFVKRMEGTTQYQFTLVSGTISVEVNTDGYDIMTNDLVISKGGELYDVIYSYNGSIKFDEWTKIAATLQNVGDNIVDMPFTDVIAEYYGNLFGYGTGNYVITMSTDGWYEENSNAPGVYLVFNMFGVLLGNNTDNIKLQEGTYTVYPTFNSDEFSMLYGLDNSGSPFGTYVAQIDAKGNQSLEYINQGTVEASYSERNGKEICTLVYELKTVANRTIKGTWIGELPFANYAENSSRLVLSNLKHDVECDMSRVEKGRMTCIDTLMTTTTPAIEIAEAWQLWLEPRGWTEEEIKNYDWDERFQVWNPNGDVMVLEFVVPSGTYGDIAPEINKEYTYQIQPNLSLEEQLYDLSVSQMGRPYDDIFYEPYWADKYTYMSEYNARRGFTFAGGHDGNWYLHYEEGTKQAMDINAPAVKGTVTVTRTSDWKFVTGGRNAEFSLVWDLYDDTEQSNNITGEWSGPIVANMTADIEIEEKQ